MTIPFVKFQGTGNDFILIDGRNKDYSNIPVKLMCDRHFGIGADGLMILQNKEGYDFEMVYYNSDGNLSSMCGNGGRCIVFWAHQLGIGKNNKLTFWAPDGAHEARVHENTVSLKMNPVKNWKIINNQTVELNTGSPHYVYFGHDNIDDFNLIEWAKNIRYSTPYTQEGINVNTVNILGENHLKMRTYERGVEDETLSCGTGVTAAVLASVILRDNLVGIKIQSGMNEIRMSTKGGELSISFEKSELGFDNISLIGPAEYVFSGQW